MSNFKILFSHPLLLLLLIPAIAVPLFLYFRIAKKYRRTRNRVTSLVLHLIIMVLSVAVLAGMTFSYDIPNKENEVLLLVDVSFSGQDTESSKNEFVKSVIDASGSNFQVGVVTFGYGQVYAAPLTNDTDKVYRQYLNADRPDVSATDIASALKYARGLFAHPETAKIVLITDGIETDGDALNTVKSLAAEGIKVDTAFFPTDFEDDVQLIDIIAPDHNIIVGETFPLGVTLQSKFAGDAHITLYDNDKACEPVLVDLEKGEQIIEVMHTFDLPGLHKISFEIKCSDDTLAENNAYYSYIYLHVFDKILIVEGVNGESTRLVDVLKEDEYNIEVVSADAVPETLDALREYDQVILSNVANADLPEGFDEILHSYVYDVGGGLFTVGGNQADANGNPVLDENGNPVANAYNRADLHNEDGSATLLQRMLPVQAVDYTPPVGVAIIIDYSGSMGTGDNSTGVTKLEAAKQGALACLEVLTERDYCGVFGLSDTYSKEIDIIPMTQKSKIVAAIDAINGSGGTVYAPAIEYAGRALSALEDVERRHMLLITDGMPADKLEGGYGPFIKKNFLDSQTTLSIVSIGTSGKDSEMEAAVGPEYGNGKYYKGDASDLMSYMISDLKQPEIKEVEYGEFKPQLRGNAPVISGIAQNDMPSLYGFYGTKLKSGADAPLTVKKENATDDEGNLKPLKGVPVYAQWKYGAGMVGSFMCDLNGTWSADFLDNATGQRFIQNAVKVLFPMEDIRSKPINVELKEDNYTTQISIYTTLQQDESITVQVAGPTATGHAQPAVQSVTAGANDNYSRILFTNMLPGLYEIAVEKKNAQGDVIARYTGYKAFSYSEEYNVFVDPEESKLFVTNVAQNGNGRVIENNVWDIFAEVVKVLHRSLDPRLAFIILAIILFLLDIAVRKFKFKWPHELVREHREKKSQRQGG